MADGSTGPAGEIPAWRSHLGLAEEHWRRVAAGRREMARHAEAEFGKAMELAPPDLDSHMELLDVAARHGALETLRGLYFAHEEDWPFSATMVARIQACMKANAAPFEVAERMKGAHSRLHFGHFVLAAKDLVLERSRRYLGPAGPFVAAAALLALMFWINRAFLREVILLVKAY